MRNFIVKPLIGGYTQTLVTYALYYLREAESLFGPETTDYVYGGIELINGPSGVSYPYSNFVVIQLSTDTATDFDLGIYQIAHEVIHVLFADGKESTSNLEEGLAIYFSILVTHRDTNSGVLANSLSSSSKYFHSYELVRKLLEIRPTAIIELRKIQPVLGKITENDFLQANLNIPEDLIKELLGPID